MLNIKLKNENIRMEDKRTWGVILTWLSSHVPALKELIDSGDLNNANILRLAIFYLIQHHNDENGLYQQFKAEFCHLSYFEITPETKEFLAQLLKDKIAAADILKKENYTIILGAIAAHNYNNVSINQLIEDACLPNKSEEAYRALWYRIHYPNDKEKDYKNTRSSIEMALLKLSLTYMLLQRWKVMRATKFPQSLQVSEELDAYLRELTPLAEKNDPSECAIGAFALTYQAHYWLCIFQGNKNNNEFYKKAKQAYDNAKHAFTRISNPGMQYPLPKFDENYTDAPLLCPNRETWKNIISYETNSLKDTSKQANEPLIEKTRSKSAIIIFLLLAIIGILGLIAIAAATSQTPIGLLVFAYPILVPAGHAILAAFSLLPAPIVPWAILVTASLLIVPTLAGLISEVLYPGSVSDFFHGIKILLFGTGDKSQNPLDLQNREEGEPLLKKYHPNGDPDGDNAKSGSNAYQSNFRTTSANEGKGKNPEPDQSKNNNSASSTLSVPQQASLSSPALLPKIADHPLIKETALIAHIEGEIKAIPNKSSHTEDLITLFNTLRDYTGDVKAIGKDLAIHADNSKNTEIQYSEADKKLILHLQQLIKVSPARMVKRDLREIAREIFELNNKDEGSDTCDSNTYTQYKQQLDVLNKEATTAINLDDPNEYQAIRREVISPLHTLLDQKRMEIARQEPATISPRSDSTSSNDSSDNDSTSSKSSYSSDASNGSDDDDDSALGGEEDKELDLETGNSDKKQQPVVYPSPISKTSSHAKPDTPQLPRIASLTNSM